MDQPIRVGVTTAWPCPRLCPGRSSRQPAHHALFLSPTESPADGSVLAGVQGGQATGGSHLLRPGPWSGRQREPGAGVRELRPTAPGVFTHSLVNPRSRRGAWPWDVCRNLHWAELQLQTASFPEHRGLKPWRGGGGTPQTLLALVLPALAAGPGGKEKPPGGFRAGRGDSQCCGDICHGEQSVPRVVPWVPGAALGFCNVFSPGMRSVPPRPSVPIPCR